MAEPTAFTGGIFGVARQKTPGHMPTCGSYRGEPAVSESATIRPEQTSRFLERRLRSQISERRLDAAV
jgi:hypothetical protein